MKENAVFLKQIFLIHQSKRASDYITNQNSMSQAALSQYSDLTPLLTNESARTILIGQEGG